MTPNGKHKNKRMRQQTSITKQHVYVWLLCCNWFIGLQMLHSTSNACVSLAKRNVHLKSAHLLFVQRVFFFVTENCTRRIRPVNSLDFKRCILTGK